MAAAESDKPRVPATIERFVKTLVVTFKAVTLYPPSSNIPRDTAKAAVAALSDVLNELSEVRLTVHKNALHYEGTPVFPGQSAYATFALELYNRKVSEVRFHAGADERDIVAFLAVLAVEPEEIESSGGFENRLWDQSVDTVTVTEAHVTLVDAAITGSGTVSEDTRLELDPAEVDELIASAYSGRTRDQLTIARFVGQPASVAEYLTRTYAGTGQGADLMAAGERFAQLAEIAYEIGGEEGRADLLAKLGESLLDLEPSLRRSLLVDEVLPEARTNAALAAVLEQTDLDSLCRMLVEQVDLDEISREGLARAIRNLSMISMADREEVAAAAGAAMIGAGMDQGSVASVLELASPSRLRVAERSVVSGGADRPVDAIFRLMDLAPAPMREAHENDDPAVVALSQEARRGITDGDVMMALVALVSLDPRETAFASTMARIEDSFDLLIDRGEIDVAAEVAQALSDAAGTSALTDEQRTRIHKAIDGFARPEHVKELTNALRLYPPGSPEHEGAGRLMGLLGPRVIGPLIEQLAAEPDMTVRKTLIDLLSGIAPSYIRELGAYVTDGRWYVVRNVVTILGSTRSVAALAYLERTVRHADARVRREAIRAASMIPDRLALQLLVTALADDDAQNVQLAARYLGASGEPSAVNPLEQVARGDGRGNRSLGPRVEAIEALGRLGAPSSLPVLESLTARRGLLGGRNREVRAAAESAITRIKAAEGGRAS